MSISLVTNEDNMQMMARYPDKYFDLAIVDPQTGQNEDRKHASRSRLVRQKNGQFLSHKASHLVKNWDSKPPEQFYFDELIRVSKNQIIMCEPFMNFSQKSSSTGRIVWNLLRDNDFSACQIMWTSLFSKVDYFEFLYNGMIQGYKINCRVQQGNKQLNEKRIHPSQKHEIVYRELLRRYAIIGDKILDTHLGSGSSRIAAYDLGFDFYGCELDKDYFDAQEKRFAKHIAQQKLFTPQQQLGEQTILL